MTSALQTKMQLHQFLKVYNMIPTLSLSLYLSHTNTHTVSYSKSLSESLF